MDPKVTIKRIDDALADFKTQAARGEPKIVLLQTLGDLSEHIEALADWIASGGFVLVAPEDQS